MTAKPVNLWTLNDHAREYLERADSISHRSEGESALLEFIPPTTRRILDLGTGDGRLLTLVRRQHPETEAVALDFSPTMLEAARRSFAAESSVRVIAHNLDKLLPTIGKFDAVISSFAIHHLVHERKRALYAEVYNALSPVASSAIWSTSPRPRRTCTRSFWSASASPSRPKIPRTNC